MLPSRKLRHVFRAQLRTPAGRQAGDVERGGHGAVVGSLDVRPDDAVREGGGRQATIGEDVVDARAVVRRPCAGSRSPAREGVSLGRVEIPERVDELRRRSVVSVLPYDVFRRRLRAALANVPR